MTYLELIKKTDSLLNSDEGLAKFILIDFFHIDIKDIIMNNEVQIDLDKYNLVVHRLLNHEPYHYIKGDKEFYGRDFKVTNDVLIPRFETELLVSETINFIKDYFPTPTILDIGTGSGIIAITLSKELNTHVDASDISAAALEVAKLNSQIHEADVSFILSDLFTNIDKKYDVIISNPPYLSYDEEVDVRTKLYEPQQALYAANHGLAIYERIIVDAATYLNDKYLLAFETGIEQTESLEVLIKQHLNYTKLIFMKDLSGRNRYCFVINV